MKNKLIALLLISAMALSFAGCQGKKDRDRSRDRDDHTQETVDEKELAEMKEYLECEQDNLFSVAKELNPMRSFMKD